MSAILIFLVTCCGFAIALSLAIGLTGGKDSALIGLSYLSMFLPACAVFILSATRNEPPRVRWTSFPIKYLPVAFFLIPGVLHLTMLPILAVLEGRLHWQDWLTRDADGRYHTPDSRGWGNLNMEELVGHILLNAIVGLVVVSFLALFEEIGWRAWLLPRLALRIGVRRAVVVTSVIWALWHVPFQLSGIQHIDGVSPGALVLSMPLGIVATGLILGWIWLRTESIWLVAITHGASNHWGQYAFKYIQDSVNPYRDLVTLNLAALALLFIGAILLWRGVEFRSDTPP